MVPAETGCHAFPDRLLVQLALRLDAFFSSGPNAARPEAVSEVWS
jgi:hypothetical protein